MAIKLDNNDIDKLYLGSTEITKAYLGVDEVYPNTVNPFLTASLVFSIYDLGFGNIDVVRVRRSSDDAEQDFTALEITNGTLTSFCGAGDGFVAIYYNHNGINHARQIISASQHQIVSLGSLIIESGINIIDSLLLLRYRLDNTVNLNSVYFASKINSLNTVNYICGDPSPSQGFFNGGTFGGVQGIGGFDGSNVLSDTNENLNLQISYHEITSNELIVQKDNLAEVNLGAFGIAKMKVSSIFGRNTPTTYMRSKYCTFIGYEVSTRATKDDIISEINTITPIY